MQQQNKYISAAFAVLAIGILALEPAMTSAQTSLNESSNTSSSLSGEDNNAALNST
ncbi:MAG: hypothetical protein M3114_03315 [Thermoproteota archaeon]|nr:hypothetical protein [Thermoproteota archaeon]MDQ4066599.1 hypothetical protein [Thermoproteota archaeon]